MTAVRHVALHEVATIERDIVDASHIKAGTLFVGLENIESGGRFVNVRPVGSGELASSKFAFTPRHVLYGKLRPYLAKIARPDFEGICSTDILPLLPGPQLDRGYLSWFLLSPEMVSLAASRATGAHLPRLSPNALAEMRIPLPPLSEQRRIAEILDKADALRAQRRAALAQVAALTQSIFLDMFGDPATNPKRWGKVKLEEALTIPLRNGLSPSRSGTVLAQVLTLSAITGTSFDETAKKVSTFLSTPPQDQTVDANDFLICRGNGNIRLVGKGCFPLHTMPDVTFPDTMIAARVSSEKVERTFLEHVWNSPAVRQQIESLARTTNGTFKVNQSMLQSISFIGPPVSLQREFADRVKGIAKAMTGQRASLAKLDTLFASLQHLAFRGELLS